MSNDAAQTDQVAHGFVIGVRHPDGRQLSGAMKTGEHGGVATICLHPIARLHRNQRRRHHVAAMAEAALRVLGDASLQRELVDNGLALARGCAWPAVKDQWLGLYVHLASERQAAGGAPSPVA